MIDKEITIGAGAQLPQTWQATTDEIDLRELIMVLWRQKALILLVTVLFAAAGIAYALLAPQQWSAKAVIIGPKHEDLMPMQKVAVQASVLGLAGFPSGKTLHQEFVSEFNAYENRRDYMKASPLFAEQSKVLGLDDKGRKRWLRDWTKLVTAQAVDKKGEVPGIEITFAAPTAKDALVRLKGYVAYIIELQKQRLVRQLAEQRDLKLEEMTTRYTLMQEDAKRTLLQEITETELDLKVAKSSGVSSPLENYNDKERFSITLGSKGLEEKLVLLKSLDLEVYQPELQSLKVQMARLKSVALEGITFRPFSYLDAPDEPLSRDKPKRPLVVVLATLLGGMLGVGIVLVRHAFRRPEQA